MSFIGLKMLFPLFVEGLLLLTGEGGGSALADFVRRYNAHEFEQMIINVSLGVVMLAIASSIVLSLIFPSRKENSEEEPEVPEAG